MSLLTRGREHHVKPQAKVLERTYRISSNSFLIKSSPFFVRRRRKCTLHGFRSFHLPTQASLVVLAYARFGGGICLYVRCAAGNGAMDRNGAYPLGQIGQNMRILHHEREKTIGWQDGLVQILVLAVLRTEIERTHSGVSVKT